MDHQSILEAHYAMLEVLVQQFLEAIDGIPEPDLNTWKPAAEQLRGGEMNTLAAMSVHVVAAARWRIEQQVFDRDFPRDRESEWAATASREEINDQFETMLVTYRDLIDSGKIPDLTSLPGTPREDHPHWTRHDWLVTAISHTALHLGHVQIHRQLWLAEQASDS